MNLLEHVQPLPTELLLAMAKGEVDVEAIAAALRDGQKVERLSWQHTATVSTEARKLIAVAETMCGGSF